MPESKSSWWPLAVALLAVSSLTVAACDAVLGLPDPSLDETAADPQRTPGSSGGIGPDGGALVPGEPNEHSPAAGPCAFDGVARIGSCSLE